MTLVGFALLLSDFTIDHECNKNCLIITHKIRFYGKELDQITILMQADSQELSHLRECSYSHNIHPSLHCYHPPHSSSHLSDFPRVLMYSR